MEFTEKLKAAYKTGLGSAVCGDSRALLAELPDNSLNLVITSPPFALQRPKEYGNVDPMHYVDWLTEFAKLVYQKLRVDGSFVIDLGGAYRKGVPARSLHNFRALIHFCDDLGFYLAEDFYWYNPSKLPSPIEWVNKRKLRVKDSVNTIWWLSKTEWPKADVTKVLTPYSGRMRKLLADPETFYKPKLRPSGHDIGRAFARDNGGAIPSNWLQIPNTDSDGQYARGCKTVGVETHPARFPDAFPRFFTRFLTDPGDVVVDIFAGSNTTGMVAEQEARRWLAFDERIDYLAASLFRFVSSGMSPEEMQQAYRQILAGNSIDVSNYSSQQPLLPAIDF